MKTLVLADIHGNLQALEAVVRHEPFDALLFVGDCVDFGPQPHHVLRYLRSVNAVGIMGNHDLAVADGVHPGSTSPLWHGICDVSASRTRELIGASGVRFLRKLPRWRYLQINGKRVFLVHGAPEDPLRRYVEPQTEQALLEEWFADVRADYIFTGHTHLPMIRGWAQTVLANPGSVGLPKNGVCRAHYAVLDEDGVSLSSVEYDVEETIRHYQRWPFTRRQIDALAEALRTGGGAQKPDRPTSSH